MKFRAVVLMVVLAACSSKGPEPAAQPAAAPAPAPAPAPVAAAPAPAVDAAVDAFEGGVDFALDTPVKVKSGSASEGRSGKGGTDRVAMASGKNLPEMGLFIGPDGSDKLADLIKRQAEEAKHKPDELTPAEINKVVKSRGGLYKACYTKELAKKPTLAGKVTMRFTITAEGTVKDTAIDPDRSTLLDENLGACLRNQFARLRFPAKTISKVSYPLLFSAEK